MRMACCVQSIASSVRWTTSETRRPHRSMSKKSALSMGGWICANSCCTWACDKALGRGPPPAHHVTRFDRIPRDTALLDQVVKEMFQRMQAPMEGGRSSPLLVLLVNKPLDVLKRDLRKRLWTGRKEELEIERRVRERMGGVVTALEIRPDVVDRLAHDIVGLDQGIGHPSGQWPRSKHRTDEGKGSLGTPPR